MKKPKKKYAVFAKTIRCFDGVRTECEEYVGETFAVSEKQAVNQVRFRNEGKCPNYYSDDDPAETGDWRSVEYMAKELSNEQN